MKLEIYNSFCRFTDNLPLEVSDLVARVLTYRRDIDGEKAQLFNQLRLAKKYDNTKMYHAVLAKIKHLEQNEWVCWFKDNTFPTGHLNIVREVLKASKVNIDIDDKRHKPSNDLILKWYSKPKFEDRYYQNEMVNLGVEAGRGVFESAVGTGKSWVMARILKDLSVVSLIVVPSTGLSEQIYNDFKVWFGSNNIEMVDTKKVRSGKCLKPIRIITIQSMASLQKSGELQHLVGDVNAIFVDEIHHCLLGNTYIKTEDGIKTIKEIVTNKYSGKVLSFNNKTNTYEYKKVINWFSYDAPSDLIEIIYKYRGRNRILKCTENHKVWTTNRGYVEAKDLTINDDILIDGATKCNKCGKTFDSIKSCDDHRGSHKIPKEVKRKQTQCMLNHKNHNSPRARKLSSERMKKHNPMFDPKIAKKSGRNIKLAWKNLPEDIRNKRIERFINLPKQGIRKGPTKLEKRVIDLNIEDLRFTGNGKFWLKSNGKSLNPDFKVKNKRKVLEVGDIYFWHSRDDINQRIKYFNDINFDCLYLTNKEMDKMTDQKLKSIIKDFIDG